MYNPLGNSYPLLHMSSSTNTYLNLIAFCMYAA